MLIILSFSCVILLLVFCLNFSSIRYWAVFWKHRIVGFPGPCEVNVRWFPYLLSRSDLTCLFTYDWFDGDFFFSCSTKFCSVCKSGSDSNHSQVSSKAVLSSTSFLGPTLLHEFKFLFHEISVLQFLWYLAFTATRSKQLAKLDWTFNANKLSFFVNNIWWQSARIASLNST